MFRVDRVRARMTGLVHLIVDEFKQTAAEFRSATIAVAYVTGASWVDNSEKTMFAFNRCFPSYMITHTAVRNLDFL